jgi:ABC-type Fe3+ transport system substrate-binding protein
MNKQVVKPVIAVSLMVGMLAWWALGLACEQQSAPADVRRPVEVKYLTILTPHNASIREVFERGFSDWHESKRGKPVQIEWITRGTPECTALIETVFSSTGGIRDRQTPDLMFGGGIADHAQLAERGYTMGLSLETALKGIPEQVHGLPTRNAEGTWFASGLSSFGIVCNQRDCGRRGLEPAATWTDLADPRFAGWIGVADPQKSGSHRQSMMLVMQKYGWSEGWATLIRILANAPAVLQSSSQVLDQVGSGVFLASFAVNFDGLARQNASGSAVVYVNPAGATAVTPDVTSVLKSSQDAGLATDFIRYCISDEGQRAWAAKAEHHGLGGSTLYHYPIAPHMYTEHVDILAVKENPLETDFGLVVDLEDSGRLVKALLPMVHAATRDGNHILLQKAWATVIAGGMKPEAVRELTALPFGEKEAVEVGEAYRVADAESAERLIEPWKNMFREKYERVIAAGQ